MERNESTRDLSVNGKTTIKKLQKEHAIVWTGLI
jgi:hypothetical protein